MIRAYVEFAKRAFQKSMIYRIDCLAGIINTVIIIFVNISIWRAIYEEEEILEGVQFKLIVTYIVLSFLIQSIFSMNDFFIANKVNNGTISSDILKPISFRLYIFSHNMGELFYNLTMKMFPSLIVAIVAFKILPPFSFTGACYFIISLILSYLMLYHLNFIIWISSFWFYQIYSLVVIKDALILIFSGALLPLWFMPEWMDKYIRFFPFSSIYYVPISVYLGRIEGSEVLFSIVRQFIWLCIFFVIGNFLWKKATSKLVIQGG